MSAQCTSRVANALHSAADILLWGRQRQKQGFSTRHFICGLSLIFEENKVLTRLYDGKKKSHSNENVLPSVRTLVGRLTKTLLHNRFVRRNFRFFLFKFFFDFQQKNAKKNDYHRKYNNNKFKITQFFFHTMYLLITDC